MRRYRTTFQGIALAVFTLLTCLLGNAQETLRPVTTSWTVGAGSAHIADTYLSPLKYSGWNTSLGYNRMQVMPWKDADTWISRLNIKADLNRALNPAGNATMWGAELHASWGTMKRWKISDRIFLGLGPALSIDAGCLYNARNSNNPASAKCSATIDAIGFISWSHSIGKCAFTLSYQPSLPVIGAFFSPRYDELYYEIYLGNHSGLAHVAWWGSRFKLDNLVALDIHLG
ncbi:MAG: DUF3316 domain-containing protein, partial [Muribaculaceae bacterium]|nr:DUF3316 domain-containing protein [Muribaculaceae bacterium]